MVIKVGGVLAAIVAVGMTVSSGNAAVLGPGFDEFQVNVELVQYDAENDIYITTSGNGLPTVVDTFESLFGYANNSVVDWDKFDIEENGGGNYRGRIEVNSLYDENFSTPQTLTMNGNSFNTSTDLFGSFHIRNLATDSNGEGFDPSLILGFSFKAGNDIIFIDLKPSPGAPGTADLVLFNTIQFYAQLLIDEDPFDDITSLADLGLGTQVKGLSNLVVYGQIAAVPVPAALPLLFVGLIGLVLVGCRRKPASS
ncbi:MAG: VPLPA-CTERM sorting domain-containing protein [Alphaproteobacteria bacterium]